MKKLNEKFCRIGIISSIVCSFLFYSCEKTDISPPKNSASSSLSLENGKNLVSDSLTSEIHP